MDLKVTLHRRTVEEVSKTYMVTVFPDAIKKWKSCWGKEVFFWGFTDEAAAGIIGAMTVKKALDSAKNPCQELIEGPLGFPNKVKKTEGGIYSVYVNVPDHVRRSDWEKVDLPEEEPSEDTQ